LSVDLAADDTELFAGDRHVGRRKPEIDATASMWYFSPVAGAFDRVRLVLRGPPGAAKQNRAAATTVQLTKRKSILFIALHISAFFTSKL